MLALRVHLRLDLLPHRAAQQIGAAERVAGQHLGDLHDLLLVDHDAVGFLEDRLERRVQVIGRLLAVLHRDIARDVLHRARPVERDGGDDVLEAVGAQPSQHVAHARAFDLEHADRVAGAQKLESWAIVERQVGEIECDPARFQQFEAPRQHGQGLEPEKIEFDQTGELDPFHVELGRRHVGARIAIERHQFGQRPVADHHARRMGRGVAVEPFELQRDLDQPRHRFVAVARLLQGGLAGDRLFQGDRVRRVVGHQFAQAVDLAVGHRQHPADIAQHRTRLQFAKGDDLRHPIAAIFLLDVADHLVAPVLAEIDVEIRHRHALGVEKALEQQAEAQRVEIGDRQRPGDDRAGARAAARPDRDALALRPLDKVGDDQEIAGKPHLDDRVELEFEPLAIGRRFRLVDPEPGEPRVEAG